MVRNRFELYRSVQDLAFRKGRGTLRAVQWGASAGPFYFVGGNVTSETGAVSGATKRSGGRWLGQIARLFRRYPRLAMALQRGMRLVQPRFTVGAVGVLLDSSGERVLLVEHVFHAIYPWGLPGGWINRHEDPAQTVEREFYEETGLHVRAVRPVLVRLAPDLRGHMDMIYLCALGGELEPPESMSIRLSKELLGYRWTPLDDLPPMWAFQREAILAAQESGR
jgi:8-oxo-dGTP pyrophosphatase MutT (NUDIX family)